MHKPISVLVVAVTLVALVVTSATALARPVSPATSGSQAAAPVLAGVTSNGSVRTSGSAVIRVQPDRASVRLGVQTFGASPRSTQAENEAVMKRVYQAILDAGVEAKDIGTDYFSIRPQYDFPSGGKPVLLGYWSENSIQVTLREVDKLSDVLVAALDAGATGVDDLTFTTTRLRELRDQARSLAVQAAIEKAEVLAGAAHATTGSVRNIEEQSWSYYYGQWNSRGQYMSQAQNVMQEVSSSGSAPAVDDGEISLGQIVVQAQVDVTIGID